MNACGWKTCPRSNTNQNFTKYETNMKTADTNHDRADPACLIPSSSGQAKSNSTR